MKSARSDDDLNDIGILFDLDGTLVDTAGDLVAATNHVLAHDGLPTLAVEHGRHMAGVSAKTMIDAAFRAAGRSLSAEDMPSRLERFLDYYTAHIDAHSALFPDARTTIEALKRCGAKLAVCTNKREALAIDLLERLHVVDMFETIVGAIQRCAPNPIQRRLFYVWRGCRFLTPFLLAIATPIYVPPRLPHCLLLQRISVTGRSISLAAMR